MFAAPGTSARMNLQLSSRIRSERLLVGGVYGSAWATPPQLLSSHHETVIAQAVKSALEEITFIGFIGTFLFVRSCKKTHTRRSREVCENSGLDPSTIFQ